MGEGLRKKVEQAAIAMCKVDAARSAQRRGPAQQVVMLN